MAERFAVQISESFSVTLPVGLRHILKLRPGDELEIEADEHQILSVGLYRSRIFTAGMFRILADRAAQLLTKGKHPEGLEPLHRRKIAAVASVSAAGGERK